MARWQTVRVFVSTTFRDMMAERDALQTVVFPAIRQRLVGRRVNLDDFDLRWGLSGPQSTADLLVRSCLERVDDCDVFLCILGQRYGFLPRELPGNVAQQFNLNGLDGRSVTEYEIRHGVFHNQQARAAFFFRHESSLANVPAPLRERVYQDHSPSADESASSLQRLKEEVREQCRRRGLPCHEYTCDWDPDCVNPEDGTRGRLVKLEPFCDTVVESLWQLICDLVPKAAAPPLPNPVVGSAAWLEHQDSLHDEFGYARAREIVGDEHVGLPNQVGGSEGPRFFLVGSDVGRSTTLANFAIRYRKENPQALVLWHFTRASSHAASLQLMLLRLCLALAQETNSKPKIPDDSTGLRLAFHRLIEELPDRQVVLVLDGLELLGAAGLDFWLFVDLPNNVNISCSANMPASGKPFLEQYQLMIERQRMPIPVGKLSIEHRRIASEKYLRLYGKTLDERLIWRLVNNPFTQDPLFLRTALEEIRLFGSHKDLKSRIRQLPRTGRLSTLLKRVYRRLRVRGKSDYSLSQDEPAVALFTQVLKRLENQFGQPLVRQVLSAMLVSKQGLSATECAELADRSDATSTSANVHSLLQHLRPHLLTREGHSWVDHMPLGEAVRRRYLPDHNSVRDCSKHLGDFFATKLNLEDDRVWQNPDEHALSEVVFQFSVARDLEGIARFVFDVGYLSARTRYHFDELIADLNLVMPKLLPIPETHTALKVVCRVLDQSAEVVKRRPEQLRSQIAARLSGFPVPSITRLLADLDRLPEPWFKAIRPSLPGPDDPLLRQWKSDEGAVSCLMAIPDGRRVISGHDSGRICIWDTRTGELLQCLAGHEGSTVNALALIPYNETLLSAGADNMLYVWNVDSGQCALALRGHAAPVMDVDTFDKDIPPMAVSTSQDQMLILWDLLSGIPYGHLGFAHPYGGVPFGEGGPAYAAAVEVLRGQMRILVGDVRGVVRVWKVHPPNCSEISAFATEQDLLRRIAVSPDQRFALTISQFSGPLKVWSIDSGTQVTRLGDRDVHIPSARFLHDGQRIISVQGDGRVCLWDLHQPDEAMHLGRHPACARDVVALPGTEGAVSADENGNFMVWNLEEKRTPVSAPTHGAPVGAIMVMGQAPVAVSGGADGSVYLWDLQSSLGNFRLADLNQPVRQIVQLHQPGHFLVTTQDMVAHRALNDIPLPRCAKSQVILIELGETLSTKTLLQEYCLLGHIVVTSDGPHVVILLSDRILVWDQAAEEPAFAIPVEESESPWVCLIPGRQTLVTRGGSGNLAMWDLATGARQATIKFGSDRIERLWVATDQQHGLATTVDQQLVIVDLAHGEIVHHLRQHADVWQLVLTADRRYAVASEREGPLVAWDLATPRLTCELRGGCPFARHLAAWPLGSTVLIGSDDGSIELWDISEQRMLMDFTAAGSICALSVSSDGSHVVAGDRTGRVHLLKTEGL